MNLLFQLLINETGAECYVDHPNPGFAFKYTGDSCFVKSGDSRKFTENHGIEMAASSTEMGGSLKGGSKAKQNC